MTQPGVVIIGAGQAGFQAAVALRDFRYEGRVMLIGDERHPPYRRPPLSKTYLLGEASEDQVSLCPEALPAQRNIELVVGKRAVALDRARRAVKLDDGSEYAYEHLVLATGTRNRRLSVPGSDLGNVCYLRTRDEADQVRAALSASVHDVVVIGAGFIGLEFAACAAKLGRAVTVLEVAERPMARVVSPVMSAIFAREHAGMGVRLQCNSRVSALRGDNGRVTGVETADGRLIKADLVVVGIGVEPNAELAADSGLVVDNGIVVDELLLTSDPHISAIGDVAAHVNRYGQGLRLRLESVQNACDQGRCVAARIAGKPAVYDALPWFWSHQGSLRLQLAGLPAPGCEEVVRGDPEGSECSIFLLRGERLVCVESLNKPAEHMLARRLITKGARLTAEQARDRSFDLKSLLA